jgi:hypothetical protein
MLLLFRSLLWAPVVEPPVDPPVNGPSGGANWLSGYRPLFSYAPKKKNKRRNELLLLKV